MVSYRDLSDLHIISHGQNITADYYVEEVMKKTAASAMQRKKGNGPPSKVKLMLDMSKAIFQQDGAPAHHARKTQDWCRGNFPGFWEKGRWYGNSLHLSPIENLWAIVKAELNKTEPATSEKTLIQNVQVAWRRIKAETLDNLMRGMMERLRE